jgi:DNA-binding MarR family transcriptional regulator
MVKLESLTNNNFKLLLYLYDKKDADNLIRITQTEISEDLCLNRGTVNDIFKSLKENGFLVHDKTRIGRYYITDEAVKVIELLKDNLNNGTCEGK